MRASSLVLAYSSLHCLHRNILAEPLQNGAHLLYSILYTPYALLEHVWLRKPEPASGLSLLYFKFNLFSFKIFLTLNLFEIYTLPDFCDNSSEMSRKLFPFSLLTPNQSYALTYERLEARSEV